MDEVKLEIEFLEFQISSLENSLDTYRCQKFINKSLINKIDNKLTELFLELKLLQQTDELSF